MKRCRHTGKEQGNELGYRATTTGRSRELRQGCWLWGNGGSQVWTKRRARDSWNDECGMWEKESLSCFGLSKWKKKSEGNLESE